MSGRVQALLMFGEKLTAIGRAQALLVVLTLLVVQALLDVQTLLADLTLLVVLTLLVPLLSYPDQWSHRLQAGFCL